MKSIEIDVGDTVEVTFKLKYKKAEVQRRPDKDAYQRVVVEATSPVNSKVIMAFDQEVTADDQAITGDISFAPTPHQPDFFKPGETWTVTASYTGADLTPAPHRTFTLGTIVIRAAEARA